LANSPNDSGAQVHLRSSLEMEIIYWSGQVERKAAKLFRITFTLLQCCGSGSGAFLTPGSGIRNGFIPDPGSRIPNSYFLDLSDNFLGKKFHNSLKFGPNFYLEQLKNKIILHFVKFVATKKCL
jgi:hypothetical protein